jgi:quinol monooxygenase YgiN
MPVTVIATLHAQDGKQDDVLQAVSQAAADVHAEAGCLKYAPQVSGRNRVVIVESWESREALDAHAKSPGFTALGKQLEGLLSQPLDVQFAAPAPAGDPTKGAL